MNVDIVEAFLVDNTIPAYLKNSIAAKQGLSSRGM